MAEDDFEVIAFKVLTYIYVGLQNHLSSAKPTKTKISRTDNLQFRPGVEKDLFGRV